MNMPALKYVTVFLVMVVTIVCAAIMTISPWQLPTQFQGVYGIAGTSGTTKLVLDLKPSPITDNHSVFIDSATQLPTTSTLVGKSGTPSISGNLGQYDTAVFKMATSPPTRNNSNNTSITHKMTGYMIAHTYEDQLTAALRNYFQLAEIASHWNLKLVEPFVHGNLLRKASGFRGLPPRGTYLRFGDIFNTSQVYRHFDRCLNLEGRKLITTIEDFVVNAKRQVVSLIFLIGGGGRKQSPVLDCSATRSHLPLITQLNRYLNRHDDLKHKAIALHGEHYQFKGVGAICVYPWHFSMQEVEKKLLEAAKKHSNPNTEELPELTVGLPVWRYVTPRTGAFYFYDPDFKWYKMKKCKSPSDFHGRVIKEAADVFAQSLHLLHPVVALHIRIEKLAYADAKDKGLAERCLERLEQWIQSLQMKHNVTSRNIVAMHDMGEYGSGTIKACAPCPSMKTKVLTMLDRLRIGVIYYQPQKFHQKASTAFASMVDKEFLSRVDYLLTIGGGSFQNNAAAAFLNTHDESDLLQLNTC